MLLACAGCGGTTDGSAVAGSVSATTTAPASSATSSPAASSSSSSGPASSSSAPASGNDVLGPFGWGPVLLGQDAAAAGATGVFTDMPPAEDTCVEWSAVLASPLESVIVSPRIGVAAIIARSDAVVRTPEGVRIGSTADEVHAAYPAFDVADVETPNGPVIAATGNPAGAYRLSFNDAGTVAYLALESTEQDCYG